MVPAAGEEARDGAAVRGLRWYRIGCAAILLLAAAVRFVGLDQVPAGLFCDEAGNGYNAFSLLKSGRDEEGKILPLYVWSFGISYKNPVFIYSAIPVVGVLGLSEFSIRLTAALWGVLGVAALLWLGSEMFGRRGGLWSGLFLAVAPWHVHFSRVAFELIAVLPLFAAGFACFLRGVRGSGRWLVAAALLFAASLYAYAPAKMFVPLFLLGAVVLYARPLLTAGRWTLAAAATGVLAGMPLLVFDVVNRGRAGQYFSETTVWKPGRSLAENLNVLAEHWPRFYSFEFLFTQGDPLVRHSVPEVGQLYLAMAPLMVAGVLWCLRWRRPQGKVLLWWLALYPLAPSLMNEIPSASRGFFGAGAFCLLAGGGAAAMQKWIAGDGSRTWRVWAHDIVFCLLGALMVFEAGRYGHRYVTVYPAAAADSFQYGYGEAIAALEARRPEFDRLFLTTSDGNQPQVFPLFYNHYPPDKWLERFDPGYLVIDPAEFDRYDPERERILAALRESDLPLFDSVREVERIYDPGGRLVFVIAEIEQRGFYIRSWLMLGPLGNADGAALQRRHFPDGVATLDAVPSPQGELYWRRILANFVRIELHHFYRSAIERSGDPPVWVCAYATTDLTAESAGSVVLELGGNTQWAEVWLDGKPVSGGAVQLGMRPYDWLLPLRRGSNQLLLKTCRGDADWSFTARLHGASGGGPQGVTAHPRVRTDRVPDDPIEPPAQVVSGFSHIVFGSHTIASDGDYRGSSAGWAEHLYDGDGAVEWETAPPAQSAAAAFVFTAVVGSIPGRAQLWVNGAYALEFDTGHLTAPVTWRGNGFGLHYDPRESGGYRSGVWILYAPAARVEAGRPLRLRVSHVDGHHDASFMIKDRGDTAEHENLTADRVWAAVAPAVGDVLLDP